MNAQAQFAHHVNTIQTIPEIYISFPNRKVQTFYEVALEIGV
jgi:hypothetical protein